MPTFKLTDKDLNGMRSRGLNITEVCAYKYCYNRGVGQTIIIFPEEMREWMRKTSHNDTTISTRHAWRVINNLCDRGFGEITRSGFGRVELVIYSLDFVFGRQCQIKTETPKPDPESPEDSNAAEKNRTKQQQLILTKQICRSAGVNYRLEKDWWEIALHGIEKIKATIDTMRRQLANPRTSIYNPCGWLKVALRDNYYLDSPAPEDLIPLYEQAYFWAKDKLMDLTGCVPKKIGEAPATQGG